MQWLPYWIRPRAQNLVTSANPFRIHWTRQDYVDGVLDRETSSLGPTTHPNEMNGNERTRVWMNDSLSFVNGILLETGFVPSNSLWQTRGFRFGKVDNGQNWHLNKIYLHFVSLFILWLSTCSKMNFIFLRHHCLGSHLKFIIFHWLFSNFVNLYMAYIIFFHSMSTLPF